jgi:signal peptidase II
VKTFQKVILTLIILCTCVGCDQVTKSIAEKHLAGSPTIYLLGDTVRLQYTRNTGAFLGMGSRLPETARFWIFTIFAGVLLIGVFGFILSTKEINHITVIAAALILGGGLSNLVDRALYNGAVVDFLNIGIGKLRTGIFNVADVAIMAGTGLLVLETIIAQRKTESHLSTD